MCVRDFSVTDFLETNFHAFPRDRATQNRSPKRVCCLNPDGERKSDGPKEYQFFSNVREISSCVLGSAADFKTFQGMRPVVSVVQALWCLKQGVQNKNDGENRKFLMFKEIMMGRFDLREMVVNLFAWNEIYDKTGIKFSSNLSKFIFPAISLSAQTTTKEYVIDVDIPCPSLCMRGSFLIATALPKAQKSHRAKE